MKTLIKVIVIIATCLPVTLCAQWTPNGTTITTNQNVGIGESHDNFSLYVRKDQSGWQSGFQNRGGIGSDVFIAHGAGYGMYIRGRTTGDQYTLQLNNINGATNVFYNNGKVGLGLVGNVGIGTANPSDKLHVNGPATMGRLIVTPQNNTYEGGDIKLQGAANYNDWSIDNYIGKFRLFHSGNVHFMAESNGNVGVGSNFSKGDLQINDRLVIDSPNGIGWGRFANNAYWDGSDDVQENNPKRVVEGYAAEYTMTSTGDLMLRTAGTGGANSTIDYKTNMFVKNNGGIGINTSYVPNGYELAVDGKIIAAEVKVRPSTYWPDYVFTPKYKLMSINEVSQYINKNGHLPNMPKAEIVESEGYHIGEMNAKLLEKIEELTLYAIDADKKVEQQQQQIDELAQLVNGLKQQIVK